MKREEEDQPEFEILRNDGTRDVMRKLIDLKNIFAKQLPKMPKEYIVRLIFNKNHESIVVKQNNKILGGICYCIFDCVKLCEIVFLAISSDFQTKGFGTKLMNNLKKEMQARKIQFLMTCADNLAIGYFKKQGFHKDILMPSELYKGYLKDYEGSTLMEFLLHHTINYLEIAKWIQMEKRKVIEYIKANVTNGTVYPGITENEWKNATQGSGKQTAGAPKIPFEKIKGLKEANFDSTELKKLKEIPKSKNFKESCLKVLAPLVAHQSAWPFLQPVKKEEVPDYFDIIAHPMDFQTIKDKISNNEYTNKKSFEADVMLVFANAKQYNTKNTIFYKSAEIMEQYARNQLANMKESQETAKDSKMQIED